MLKTSLSALALAAAASQAFADCDTVTFSDVGWTDITATTAATTVVLEALGYETDIKILSVPVTYTSLAAGDIDVFLGNWMPTMEADIAPYREAGTVDTVRANLEGAKYTLADQRQGRRARHHQLSPTSQRNRTRSRARSTGSSPATTATA
jgi:glycine betaine/proline transport system substrate-binding protein